MSTDLVKEPVSPNPGLPRTIGVLNLLVGGFLLVAGGWVLYEVVPFLRENTPFRIEADDAQNVVDGVRQELVFDLNQKERAAKTEDEKASIRKERDELQAKSTRIRDQVDFAKVNGGLYWVSAYLWADLASGPVLNVLLVVSGFGLIGLKGWARTLAEWVAALKLIRLLVLSGVLGGVVVPNVGRAIGMLGASDVGDGILRSVLGRANDMLGTSVTLSSHGIVQGLNWVGYAYAVLALGFGAIYPAIVLLVLTRPGARAACS